MIKPKKVYVKNSPYICKVCSKKSQMNNKWQHERSKYHKLVLYCKTLVNERMTEMLKSNSTL